MDVQAPTTFALIGTGYRAEYFLRVAAALPERLRVQWVHGRNRERLARLHDSFAVPVTESRDEVVSSRPDFVIVCLAWDPTPETIVEMVEAGLPVLSETPPAPDLPGLRDLWDTLGDGVSRVQVAEQYQFQPMNAARIAIARSGLLGEPVAAHSWHCHGYHGVSLLRLMLGASGAGATVEGFRSTERLLRRPARTDESVPLTPGESSRTMARLSFGDRYGVFEWDGEQYFSPIRSRGLALRGTRGELSTDTVHWLTTDDRPMSGMLTRHMGGVDGDMSGHTLWSVALAGDDVYRNPVAPARLYDDEIAGADMLLRMGDYTRGGPAVYPLADAAQDHYLSMLIEQAVTEGAPVTADPQPWNEDRGSGDAG